MSTETQKREFVTSFRNEITKIIQAAHRAETAITVYVDRNYGPSGADEITDAHLAILGVTVADLVAGKGLVDNLLKLITNQTPIVANYEETFSKLRTDFNS